MSKFSSLNLPAWVQSKVLTFLNKAQKLEDLTGGKVEDHSNREKTGYALGETVAKRILDKRNSLPLKRFRSFGQLDDIQGLGEDKVNDMARSLGISADAEFKNNLYGKGILLDNFMFRDHSNTYSDKNEFSQIAQNKGLLIKEVQKLVQEACLVSKTQPLACSFAVNSLNSLYLERFSSAFVGSYAFALWFFHFDEDNWFSFETIQREAAPYLESYADLGMGLELNFFKGFQNGGILAGGVTVDDLPVVVNYPEQRITIWSGQLND